MICPHCGYDMKNASKCLRCGYQERELSVVVKEEEPTEIDADRIYLTGGESESRGGGLFDLFDPLGSLFGGLFGDVLGDLFGFDSDNYEDEEEEEELQEIVEVRKVELLDENGNPISEKKHKHHFGKKKNKDDKGDKDNKGNKGDKDKK